jgi:hypothetical protein
MRRAGQWWCAAGVALLAGVLTAPAATAAPFRVTLPQPHTGTVADRLPSWTFAADQLPDGFAVFPSGPPDHRVLLQHPSQVSVLIEAFGSGDIFPVLAPPARIAPAGATVAADGSWTLEADTYRFGRFADGSGHKIWLEGTIFIFDGDVRTATPEQAAALAAAHSALEPSLRVWYGLDPRTTSETNRAGVIAAVTSAIHRTAALSDWSATIDEAGLAPRPGPRKRHSVYAVRERRGRISVSYGETRPPGVRRLHRGTRSWQFNPKRGCWTSFTDVGPPPIPVPEPLLVRSGPASLSLIGQGGQGLNSTIFATKRPLQLAYDVTAKPPLSLGRRGTRYELYVYAGFRVHLIVDVNRAGIATVIKEEQLDAQGVAVERERIGITTPAPRRLLKPGRSC